MESNISFEELQHFRSFCCAFWSRCALKTKRKEELRTHFPADQSFVSVSWSVMCKISGGEGFFFFFFLNSPVCTLLPPLRCLSGNNGFLFIPLAHRLGLLQGLCCLPYYLVLSVRFFLFFVFFTETWMLVPGGEFLHDGNQHPVILRPRSTFLLSLFHFSVVILCVFLPVLLLLYLFLPAPRRCFLVFTYSPIQSNKSEALQPAACVLLLPTPPRPHPAPHLPVTHILLPRMLLLLSLVGPHDFSGRTRGGGKKKKTVADRGSELTH